VRKQGRRRQKLKIKFGVKNMRRPKQSCSCECIL
jgi:hypothetical protein